MRAIHLVEGIKDNLELLPGNSGPRILHFTLHSFFVFDIGNSNRYTARFSKLNRVINQVSKNLNELGLIGKKRGKLWVNFPINIKVLPLDLIAEQLQHLAPNIVDGDRLRMNGLFASFELGYINGIFDLVQQACPARPDSQEAISLPFIDLSKHPFGEELGIGENDGHGCTKFMGDDAEQSILNAVRLL